MIRMKLLFIILSVFTFTSSFAQKKNLNLSSWHFKDKIEASDYQPVRKSELSCFISNDNDNIYVDIKVDNRKIQHRILTEGMTIWVNMDGQEIKKLGIRFPVGSLNQSGRKNAVHDKNAAAHDESIDNLLLMANTIEIIGFISEQQRRFPSENHDSFRGSVKYGDGTILYYTLIIPLAKLPLRNSKDGHGAMPFILGIEYGTLNVTNSSGPSRGPAPNSIFHGSSAGKERSELTWIKDIRLATSR
jgi:hypothetical protein